LHVWSYPRPDYIFRVSSKSVQGFRSPGGPNLAFPITLASRFYNSLYKPWQAVMLCNISLNTPIACSLVCFPGMTSSLAKVNKSSGAQFLALFLKFPYLLMILNIQIDLLILKTYHEQFTLTTKKSLHIIFNADFFGPGFAPPVEVWSPPAAGESIRRWMKRTHRECLRSIRRLDVPTGLVYLSLRVRLVMYASHAIQGRRHRQ